MNAKKMRKIMGAGAGSGPGGGGLTGEKAPLKSQIDEKKEMLKLKREIREKKVLEKKLVELEHEA
jgi:hypothetical protein